MNKIAIFSAVSAVVLFSSGCARFEPARARQEQTDSFSSNLVALAEANLTHALTLDDCIRIAMVNNYDIRQADLNQELYRLGKNVAFTAFLPNVAASAGYTAYSKDPAMTSRHFESASINIGLPIFMPSTWFLYAATRHGHAAARIASHYTRQGIVMQTTMNYYNVIVQLETIAALQTQLEAAKQTAHRVAGLSDEGLVTKWEGNQALYQLEAREVELATAKRQLNVLRGEFLQGLGLSPLARVVLVKDTEPPARPEGDTEALVLKALEINPQLAIADRQVVMKEHGVRQAFCDFIPNISLFANREWTGNDLAAQSANWITGLNGAWTLFDGLANIATYRASKVEREQAKLERETTFLNVMVGVVTAEAAMHDAADAARLAQRAYDVAAAKYADYSAKAEEGLIPLGDALDAQAEMNLAEVALVKSRYQERIAIANLDLAIGSTLVPDEKTPDEQPADTEPTE